MGSYDFSAMANALPPQPYRPQGYGQNPQRYNTATASMMSPGTAAQVPAAQYGGGTAGMGLAQAQQYYLPHHMHMAPFYPTPLPPQPPTGLPPRPELGYYQSPVVMSQPPHPAAQFYYTPAPPFPGQVPHVQGQFPPGQYGMPTPPQYPDSRTRQLQLQPGNRETNSVHPSVVRGPPRKPRQSGHAIWIGNLPPQTDLMSLVHHACKETDGLESLFLISKSNCAFANFKDDRSCAAAQRKLHDSKFMTVRLVSRLRKSTVEGPAGVTAPTGPAASVPQAGTTQEPGGAEGIETNGNGPVVSTPPTSNGQVKAASPVANGASFQRDRFFVLKSLTVEDLELSVRTKTWATQSHNEQVLNSAFKSSDNVYLIFSANKSGEYFGYARMTSSINDDPAAAIEFAPSTQLATDIDLPKAIPTEPTEFAPKGRIVDDSGRGTIFWEADRDDKAPDGPAQDDEGSGGSGGSVGGDTGSVQSVQEGGGGDGGDGSEPKAWGKPFRLEWLSSSRLPFYRTRGLRNPWNSNREVKIARDGTELEPSVGRRLIGLFNRAQSPALAILPGMVPQIVPMGARVPVSVPAGYPPMRS
ncbi:hypothetical protein BT67DRAFT_426838 [Trichocladium antarcticum]|uniref:YTH domain-containing protein n=1 Tax=Trichocladium antarcticum TaxID=1450529 RepID=A0AAN6UFB5_9PEZI|nr:hypothetical protein BT67DRAFT_426838 [Trichocladium antarcticum]